MTKRTNFYDFFSLHSFLRQIFIEFSFIYRNIMLSRLITGLNPKIKSAINHLYSPLISSKLNVFNSTSIFRNFATKGIRKKRMGTTRETRSMNFSEYLILAILGVGGFASFDLIFDLNLGTKKLSDSIGLTEQLKPVQDLIHKLFGEINAPVEDEILMPWEDFCMMAGAPEGNYQLY